MYHEASVRKQLRTVIGPKSSINSVQVCFRTSRTPHSTERRLLTLPLGLPYPWDMVGPVEPFASLDRRFFTSLRRWRTSHLPVVAHSVVFLTRKRLGLLGRFPKVSRFESTQGPFGEEIVNASLWYFFISQIELPAVIFDSPLDARNGWPALYCITLSTS